MDLLTGVGHIFSLFSSAKLGGLEGGVERVDGGVESILCSTYPVLRCMQSFVVQ